MSYYNKRDGEDQSELFDLIASPTNYPRLLKNTGMSSYHVWKGFYPT